jgi:signal transduction histidine kinase
MVSEPAAVERITRAVDDLDTSIRQVRSTIFELHQRWSARLSLRADIVGICDESAKAIGFKPSCDIVGPIDSAVTEPTRGHLLLCLREALSNVARHARATAVQVDVSVDQGFLSLRVTDDGVGYQPAPDQRSSGLDNMRVRAEALGGAFSIEVRPQGGTLATWEVPLAPEGSSPDEIGTQGPT